MDEFYAIVCPPDTPQMTHVETGQVALRSTEEDNAGDVRLDVMIYHHIIPRADLLLRMAVELIQQPLPPVRKGNLRQIVYRTISQPPQARFYRGRRDFRGE